MSPDTVAFLWHRWRAELECLPTDREKEASPLQPLTVYAKSNLPVIEEFGSKHQHGIFFPSVSRLSIQNRDEFPLASLV